MLRAGLAALAAGLVAVACSATPRGVEPSPRSSASDPGTHDPGDATDRPSPTTSPALSDADLERLHVNELGRVLVVEWHDLGEVDARWDNSLATFRAQIQELYDRGYRPVTIEEFAAGTFPIPAGTSPVLLTFDDSYRAHMSFGPDGQPHADTAVGILEAFAAAHDDWRATAVFYLYWPVPFRESDVIDAKLRWLVDHGYELGNHTHTHDDLSLLDDSGVQRSLALAQAEVAERIPGYELRSFALTFGKWPTNRALASDGAFEGTSYHHDLILQVGFMPTRSPHHAEFDPTEVQRVQSFVEEFRKWVDWLDGEPHRRFISDGDPATVTYPARFSDVARPRHGFVVRTYGVGATP